MNQTLSVTFTAPPVIADHPWLRLEQVGIKPDTATIAEAADLVNQAYQLDSCGITGQEGTPVDQSKFQEIVRDTFDLSLCDSNPNGDTMAQVKVIISDPSAPYVLRLSPGATIEQARMIEEEVSIRLKVENKSGITLPWPVIGAPVMAWEGSVYGEGGMIPGPDIDRSGTVLNFGVPVTGIISAQYLTRYYLVDIDYPGDTCHALCFALHLVAALDLQRPAAQGTAGDWQKYCNPQIKWIFPIPDITCYEMIEMSWRCECDTNQESRNVTIKRSVPCPDGFAQWGMIPGEYKIGDRYEIAGYEYCPDLTTSYGAVDLSDPDYYAQICCHAPTNITLPKCSTVTSKNTGGAGIKNGEDFYRKIYGPNTKFVPVSPSDGDCGVTETTQLVIQQNCCDGVLPIYWDYDNSAEVIADNSKALVVVTGGQAPYTWQVRGSGFWANEAHTWRDVETDVPYLWIYTENACGSCYIWANDGCSDTAGLVRAANGVWAGDCIANYWSDISVDISLSDALHTFSMPVVYKCNICGGDTYTVGGGVYTVIDTYIGSPFSLDHNPVGMMVWLELSQVWSTWDNNYDYDSDCYGTLGSFWFNTYKALYTDWMAATAGMAARGIPPNLYPSDYAPNGPSDIVDMLCYDDPNAIPCQWVC